MRVGAAVSQTARLFERQRHRMKHGKADEGVGHHQRGGRDLREHGQESAEETECQRDGQRDQRHRRQCRARQIRPGTVQPARCCGDLAGEPQVERQASSWRRSSTAAARSSSSPATSVRYRRSMAHRAQARIRSSALRRSASVMVSAPLPNTACRQGGQQHGEACDPEQDTAEPDTIRVEVQPAPNRCLGRYRSPAVPAARDGRATRPATPR